ncbi:AbrB/MazE/SpoVT family DNA-binding domain-containing protein [Rathayibacter soli]|uniref:AbrB/MazE/SpoVT family DNA-binding domain-containing protein n=1 Tax=Rathayibacter soli TaxID=3144168 RepID=UPI0027E46C59|nr:AbrB/MazE/SpoVT family DNA-binding domain-containing protein [Glaciibacter superstes]
MSIAKMTSKGQITVPRNVRSELKLVPGSRLQFISDGAGGFVVTRKRRSVTELKGILKYDGAPKSLEDMEAGIARGAAQPDGQ